MTKKSKITVFVLLLTKFAFGQNINDSIKWTNKPTKNYIGLFCSLAKLYPNPNIFIYHQGINYRPGAHFERVFNKKTSMTTGIMFNINNSVYHEPYIRSTHTLRIALQIPLLINYRFTKKPIAPFINFGIIGGNMLFYREVIKFNNASKNSPSTNTSWGIGYLSSYYFNTRVGIGADANIKNLNIKLFPLYEITFDYRTFSKLNYILDKYLGFGITCSYLLK